MLRVCGDAWMQVGEPARKQTVNHSVPRCLASAVAWLEVCRNKTRKRQKSKEDESTHSSEGRVGRLYQAQRWDLYMIGVRVYQPV